MAVSNINAIINKDIHKEQSSHKTVFAKVP